MTRLSPGQSVVEALRAEGISYVFGIVGGTFLEVLDALYDAEDIKFVSVRHEQGAAFMADGFARASGQPAVCLVTNGPGATNLVSGVYAAYTGHSPVISISGAPSRDVVYRDAFQETDHVSLFRPVTKQALSVNAADRIPELFRHAFRTAMTGKKGPVFIDIPRDLLDGAPSSTQTRSRLRTVCTSGFPLTRRWCDRLRRCWRRRSGLWSSRAAACRRVVRRRRWWSLRSCSRRR